MSHWDKLELLAARDAVFPLALSIWFACFTFLVELPKTATGKVQKYVLRGGRAAIAKQ